MNACHIHPHVTTNATDFIRTPPSIVSDASCSESNKMNIKKTLNNFESKCVLLAFIVRMQFESIFYSLPLRFMLFFATKTDDTYKSFCLSVFICSFPFTNISADCLRLSKAFAFRLLVAELFVKRKCRYKDNAGTPKTAGKY